MRKGYFFENFQLSSYNFICKVIVKSHFTVPSGHNMQPCQKRLAASDRKYMYKPAKMRVRNSSCFWKGMGKICRRTKRRKTRNGRRRKRI